MKSIYFYFLCLCLFITNVLFAQKSSSWFTVKQIDSKTWLIDEHGAVNMYLLEGNNRALLIDTGLGVADLFSVVRSITNKPLYIVNTHGHIDHAGANYQFDSVYVHTNDMQAIQKFNFPPSRKSVSEMTNKNYPSKSELYKEDPKKTKNIPIREGYVFDLGGRKVEVVETPGHTAGSICLLDVERKVLYSGDTNNTIVWLFLDESLPLSDYLVTLKKELSRINEFSILMPGHGPQASSEFIKDQVECVKSILNGTCEKEILETFLGNKTLCKYGAAQVAYNPQNL